MNTPTLLTGVDLYRSIRESYAVNFQDGSPSFSNLIWQLVVNEAWKDNRPHCFTPVYDGTGLTIGIAEEREPGYYKTHVYFNTGITYDEAQDILNSINKVVFGLTQQRAYQIILSSH